MTTQSKNGLDVSRAEYERTKGEHNRASLEAGFVEMFRAAGFEEVERRSPTRPIMRYEI